MLSERSAPLAQTAHPGLCASQDSCQGCAFLPSTCAMSVLSRDLVLTIHMYDAFICTLILAFIHVME